MSPPHFSFKLPHKDNTGLPLALAGLLHLPLQYQASGASKVFFHIQFAEGRKQWGAHLPVYRGMLGAATGLSGLDLFQQATFLKNI